MSPTRSPPRAACATALGAFALVVGAVGAQSVSRGPRRAAALSRLHGPVLTLHRYFDDDVYAAATGGELEWVNFSFERRF
jgi:hypothetical protein